MDKLKKGGKFKDGAALLRRFKEENLLTVETLADAIGCSIDHMRAIHSGQSNLTVEHLKFLRDQEIFTPEQIDTMKYAYGYGKQPEILGALQVGQVKENPLQYNVVVENPEIPQHINIDIDLPAGQVLSPGQSLNITFNITFIVKTFVLVCFGTAVYTALRSIGLWKPGPVGGCAPGPDGHCPPPRPIGYLPPPRLIRILDNATLLFALILLIILIIGLVRLFKTPQSNEKSVDIKLSILSMAKYTLAVAAMVALRFVILPSFDLLPHGEITGRFEQVWIAVSATSYLFYLAILIPAYYLLFLIIKDFTRDRLWFLKVES